MTEAAKRQVVVWAVAWAAVVVVGLLMYGASESAFLNPPQCPAHETTMPDGSRCIIGANIGAGMAYMAGIAIAACGGLGLLFTPLVALLLCRWAGGSAGRNRVDPRRTASPEWAWAGGSPDWAGRHPYTPGDIPLPSTDSDPVCMASMITGIGAIGFLLLCGFLSVPLGVVALITGIFGLTGASDEPSSNRRNALVGTSCGTATFLILSIIWSVL